MSNDNALKVYSIEIYVDPDIELLQGISSIQYFQSMYVCRIYFRRWPDEAELGHIW